MRATIERLLRFIELSGEPVLASFLVISDHEIEESAMKRINRLVESDVRDAGVIGQGRSASSALTTPWEAPPRAQAISVGARASALAQANAASSLRAGGPTALISGVFGILMGFFLT
ncbi:MAG: hypothetical protein ACE5GX_04145 [Thermoanaerobaculia bacterium]